MNLSVCSTTLREIGEGQSTFPPSLRQIICQSMSSIPVEEIDQLLSKHETDPNNFDSRVEANIRSNSPTGMTLYANHKISSQTKFNCDIVIRLDDISVCLEIEKGYLSRFELDVLKMQAFAHAVLEKDPQTRAYGAFIIPADNVVASHISGNRKESSFKYLTRLSRLVSQIQPSSLSDLLIVGYGTTDLNTNVKAPKRQDKPDKRQVSYVIKGEQGLVKINTIKSKLQGYPLDLAFQIRSQLAAHFPALREKLNFNSNYLGYSNGKCSDALYVYIQKQQLVLDIRVSKEEAERLRNRGVRVNPRNNFQSKAGWLTGVSLPHDSDKLNVAMELALLALE